MLAHLFLQPFTPPLPLGLCLIAAGLVVLASFVVVGVFARNENEYASYPKYNLSRSKTFRTIPNFGITTVTQIISVLIFCLIVFAGLFGNSNPVYNIAPTMIWVIWWVGIAYISAFVGDVWSILNPWKILFEWVEKAGHRLHWHRPVGPFARYPRSLGIWPALILFLVFAWIENVYSDAILPLRISQMILIYSGITWIGMILFGKDAWVRNGEAFSVAFGFLAKFAPIETRSVGLHAVDVLGEGRQLQHGRCENRDVASDIDVCNTREIIIRPFGSGLLNAEPASTTHMCFVLILLASVTFDGFTATVPWMNIQSFFLEQLPNPTLINSLGLLVSVVFFIATYLSFCLLMRLTSGINVTTMYFANRFVYTLIPIALAYHVAHFLIFLLIQGQLIIPLASDPFGFGWNIFGSGNYRLNFGLVGPMFYWSTSVIAIVTGHIIAVVLAHSIALRFGQTRGEAIRSQYPMLVLMVGYTVASLWIITQPMYMPTM